MLYTNRLLTSGLTQLFAILMLAGATHLEINAMNPSADRSLMRTDDDVRITDAVGDFDQNPRLLSGHTLIKQEGFSDENRAANANAMQSITDEFFPPATEASDPYSVYLQTQGLEFFPALDRKRPSKKARIMVQAHLAAQEALRKQNPQSHSSSSSSPSSSTPAPTTSPLTPPPCDLPQTPTAPSSTHAAAAARFAAAAKQQQQQQQQQEEEEEEEEEEAQKKAANIDSGDDDAMTTKAVSEHAKESDGNEPDGRSTDLKRKARPHKCEHPGCGRSFTERGNLQRHILLHTGEKPHKCTHDGCGTSFADSSNFTKHMLLHTGKRPFPCTYDGCGKRFKKKGQLKRSYANTHRKKTAYMHVRWLREELCTQKSLKKAYANTHRKKTAYMHVRGLRSALCAKRSLKTTPNKATPR